ncbi:MAG: alpha/beta hydrolase-fold protein, partial [Planctomycetales bacterium]
MGSWTQIKVAGHPCDVFEPDVPNIHQYTVIFLHGVHMGRLVDKPEFEQPFNESGLRVIAPHTQRSWWTDRICPEFDKQLTAERHILDNILPWIARDWGSSQVALLGTSMGGQGALRFAFKYPDTFPVVAAMSPA